MDLSDLKELLRDQRAWLKIGVVVVPDGETTHFSIEENDIYVEVELTPMREDLSCRLSFGGNCVSIPNVGDEVVVAIPDGAMDFQPLIVGTLFADTVPDDVAENVTVIFNGQVIIHDGTTGAAPLPTLDEFKNHTHTSPVGPTGIPIDPIPSVGDIKGTTVLKAK